MHYIFTVGKNPLPVALAAMHFANNGATGLVFLYSAETKTEYKAIEKFLKGAGRIPSDMKLSGAPVDAQNGREIYEQVRGATDGLGECHLHYSGGTSAMAVHAMRALTESHPEHRPPANSYLSLKAHQMHDGDGVRIGPEDLRLAYTIPFIDLIELHGHTICQSLNGCAIPVVSSQLDPLAREWKAFLDGGGKPSARLSTRLADLKEKYPRFPPKPCTNEEVAITWDCDLPSQFPAAMNQVFGKPIWERTRDGEWETELSVDGLEYRDIQNLLGGGGWFEAYAASELRSALKCSNWPNAEVVRTVYCARTSDVTEQKATFELDIVLVLGYQLVLISCTTLEGKKKQLPTKLKGFEARHRSQQLGGIGGRAIVISLDIPERIAEDEKSLHIDIGLGPNDRSLVVWGKDKIDRLAHHFALYLSDL